MPLRRSRNTMSIPDMGDDEQVMFSFFRVKGIRKKNLNVRHQRMKWINESRTGSNIVIRYKTRIGIVEKKGKMTRIRTKTGTISVMNTIKE